MFNACMQTGLRGRDGWTKMHVQFMHADWPTWRDGWTKLHVQFMHADWPTWEREEEEAH